MIAVAAATPAGPTSGPVPIPIPGGDQAQAAGLNGDEQPTFDHVLAREAQAEDRPASPRPSGDGTVSKGRDLREAGPHKDADTAAIVPADPALFFQLPLTSESLQPAGGSAAVTQSTGSGGLAVSSVSGAASRTGTPEVSVQTGALITGTPEVSVQAGALIKGMPEAADGLRVSAGRAPATALDPLPTFPPVAPTPVDRTGQPLDVKVTATDVAISSADLRVSSNAPGGVKAGDPTSTVDPGGPYPKDAPAASPAGDLIDTFSNVVKSPPMREAARPEAWQPTPPSIDQSRGAVTARSDTSLDRIGSLFLHAPTIMAKGAVEAPLESAASAPTSATIAATPSAARRASTPDTPRFDGLPAPRTTAGVPAWREDKPGESAPSIGGPDSPSVAYQSATPSVQSALPRSTPDQNESKPRVTNAQAGGKGQEPATPAANQSAWLLNPMATLGQFSAFAQTTRAPVDERATLAATSSASDRVHHIGPTDSTPTGDVGTTPSGAGLPLVHTGPLNLGAASGQPTHTTGTGADAAVYQPIVQRVLVHGAALHVAGASSSFNVVLNPRSLGMVTVHVARGQEGLQVTITPQQNDTTALLSKHLPDLIGMLKQGGQDLPVQAQVVQTHAATPAHNGTPLAAEAGQSGLNTFTNSGGQAFTGQQGNTEQRAWAATANDLFGAPDRGAGKVGTAPITVQARVGGAARVDIQA